MCYGTKYSKARHAHFPFSNVMAARFMHHFGHHMARFGSTIPYRIEDQEDKYMILIPLAGRNKEDVAVSLIEDELNIVAKKPGISEKHTDTERVGKRSMPHSRQFFRFIEVNMDIPLPTDANKNEIKSKMADGLLRIKIGKMPAKKIDINKSENN